MAVILVWALLLHSFRDGIAAIPPTSLLATFDPARSAISLWFPEDFPPPTLIEFHYGTTPTFPPATPPTTAPPATSPVAPGAARGQLEATISSGAPSAPGAPVIMDPSIEHPDGIRCHVCGDVDSQGNVVVGCPPKPNGSIGDWIYEYKIRTWLCLSGCLTMKDVNTGRFAMMCGHTAIKKLGFRFFSPDGKRNFQISQCYDAGCNAQNLATFLGSSTANFTFSTSTCASILLTTVLIAAYFTVGGASV